MDKRYQVFVSSTYADLREERQRVIQTLMEMDCIPSGMELFPAADEEQWDFIKKVIDDCDYYLLIIGGRYGSTTPDGVSYTEKEYDYAIAKGLKVLAFLHEKPDDIPMGKTDKDGALYAKLSTFRSRVAENRLVKFWKSAGELPGLVSLSLSKTIKTYPAAGWVRGGNATPPELLAEIHTLKKENDELRKRLAVAQAPSTVPIADLAEMDEKITVAGTHKESGEKYWSDWKVTISWRDLFALIAPTLMQTPNDSHVESSVKEALLGTLKLKPYLSTMDDQVFKTIRIQMMAYGLVEVRNAQTTKGGVALFWYLTQKGHNMMMQSRTIKTGA